MTAERGHQTAQKRRSASAPYGGDTTVARQKARRRRIIVRARVLQAIRENEAALRAYQRNSKTVMM